MLKRQELKQLINLSLNPDFLQTYKRKTRLIVLCLLAHIKFNLHKNIKPKNKSANKYITMEYRGKISDRINFNHIFNSNVVRTAVERFSTRDFIPFKVVYTYSSPISKLI